MKTMARVGCALVLSLAAVAQAETILVDFGTSNSFRGASVDNPDHRGNYWNGFTPGTFLANLTNSANLATAVDLGFTTAVGTDSYNGPAGVTSDPPTPSELAATRFDADALGDLGATNAVFDFFVAVPGTTVKFTLSELNPAKRYTLTFFGSRKYPTGESGLDTNTVSTRYAVTTSNGTVLASTALNAGSLDAHNSNRVATLADLVPDEANQLFVEFSGLTSSNSGYLNALQVEIQDPPPPPPADQTILIDLGNDSSYNGASVANPDANGRTWNSVYSGAYYANLVDASNQATTVDFGFDLDGGTDNFNGPAGAVDSAALGLLGGATNAANDYYVSARFQIQGLDPSRTYTLTFFGSHKFSTDDATVYSIYSDNAYTGVVASASLNVQTPGSPWLHNSNQVAVITNLTPQAGNILYVSFAGSGGHEGYLNALLLEAFDPSAVSSGTVSVERIALGSGAVALSLVGSNTVSYTLQFSTNLLDAAGWLPVLDGDQPVTAVGDGITLLTLSDTNLVDRSRLYRLVPTP